MKKGIAAVIVALLTLTGVIIPSRYVDAFVTIFMPRSLDQSVSPAVDKEKVDHNWFISSASASNLDTTIVGALRPPSAYSKADRTCYFCHGFHGSDFKSTVLLTVPVSQPGKHNILL